MFKFIRDYRNKRIDVISDATVRKLGKIIRAEVEDIVVKIMDTDEMWEENGSYYNQVRSIRNIIKMTNYEAAKLVADNVCTKTVISTVKTEISTIKTEIASEAFLDGIIKRIKDKQL